jgi:dihydropyrimidinase
MYELFGDKIIDKFTSNPARIFGLKNKGQIAEGFDGDFAIIDPKSSTEIDISLSGCDYSPYENIKLNSRVITTIVRGTIVMDRATVFPHKGKYQRREYESIN